MKTIFFSCFLVAAASPAIALNDAKAPIKRSDPAQDRARLETLAKGGDAQAQFQLAGLISALYRNGDIEFAEFKTGLDMYRRAAAQGHQGAISEINRRLAATADPLEKTRREKRLAMALVGAKAGDPAAMHQAARLLAPYNGDKSGTEWAQGISWFGKARDAYAARAQKGGADDQYELAYLLQTAPAPIGNDATGVNWLKKAAAQGHLKATTRLAGRIARGLGVAKDIPKAISMYEQAAAAGDAEAAHNLGMTFYNPQDAVIKRDQTKADLWMLKADDLGRREDGCFVAQWYSPSSRNGLPHDSAKVTALLEPRAAAGIDACLEIMGDVYSSGFGVAKDEAEAYKWYLLSAYYNEWFHGRTSLETFKKSLEPDAVRDGEQRFYAFEFIPMDAPAAPAVVLKPATPAASLSEAEPGVDAPSRRLKPTPLDFALIVGIERYRNLPPADYAENDAAAMRLHLADIGVPARNIITLKGDEATRSKLQAYLEEWLPRNVSADSRVYFYFSGHGSPDTQSGQAYLIPADGDPAFLKSTAYAVKDLYASLGRLPAKQIIIALDSCFSGAGGRSVLPKGARPLVGKINMTEGVGRLLIMTAAAGDEISGGLDEQKHGAFTYYFLRGLSGEAKTPTGAVTADSLHRYIRDRVGDAANRQNRNQTPQLLGAPDTELTRFP